MFRKGHHRLAARPGSPGPRRLTGAPLGSLAVTTVVAFSAPFMYPLPFPDVDDKSPSLAGSQGIDHQSRGFNATTLGRVSAAVGMTRA